jgi:hypothetical protein
MSDRNHRYRPPFTDAAARHDGRAKESDVT